MALILGLLERFVAVGAYYIYLSGCSDDGAAAGANILDTAILGFFTAAFGSAFYWQTTGVDFALAQGFSDPCLSLGG